MVVPVVQLLLIKSSMEYNITTKKTNQNKCWNSGKRQGPRDRRRSGRGRGARTGTRVQVGHGLADEHLRPVTPQARVHSADVGRSHADLVFKLSRTRSDHVTWRRRDLRLGPESRRGRFQAARIWGCIVSLRSSLPLPGGLISIRVLNENSRRSCCRRRISVIFVSGLGGRGGVVLPVVAVASGRAWAFVDAAVARAVEGRRWGIVEAAPEASAACTASVKVQSHFRSKTFSSLATC